MVTRFNEQEQIILEERNMDLKEYFQSLMGFDWYYAFSDDGRVWRAGEARGAELKRISNTSPTHKAMWEAWSNHMFSGEPWKTKQTPEPKLSDFVKEEENGR